MITQPMPVHYSNGARICNNQKLRGGTLWSKRDNWNYRGDEIKFLFTTTDAQVTCPVCLQNRIDLHLKQAGVLESRLERVKKFGTHAIIVA